MKHSRRSFLKVGGLSVSSFGFMNGLMTQPALAQDAKLQNMVAGVKPLTPDDYEAVDMTPAERIVWYDLRNRRLAKFKFRRQQVIGPFIVDFYCASAGVVVELDGESHLGKRNLDASRQRWLESQGLTVIRVWNTIIARSVIHSSKGFTSGTPAWR